MITGNLFIDILLIFVGGWIGAMIFQILRILLEDWINL